MTLIYIAITGVKLLLGKVEQIHVLIIRKVVIFVNGERKNNLYKKIIVQKTM